MSQPDDGDGDHKGKEAAPNAAGPLPHTSNDSAAAGTLVASTSGSASNQQEQRSIASVLDRLGLAAGGSKKKAVKQKYAFWETQPVMQFDEGAADTSATADGPIDAPKMVKDVRQEPYSLPDSFAWCDVSIGDPQQVHEVYDLLHKNYVEDDDAMFRFNYSPAFLAWALQPPGYRPDWHVGVRVKGSNKLVAFISAIPSTLQANGTKIKAVEINFLCVLKKLRSKRLAPVLIKEITRRVNLQDIWQAAYTAGVVLPRPVASCRYWHRSLNPKKLIEVGFSALAPRMTMARTIKLYRLPPAPAIPGLRPMVPGDVPALTALLNGYLGKLKLTQHFSEEEVAHWFTPQPLVIDTYVVEASPQQLLQQQPPPLQPQQQPQPPQQQDGAPAAATPGDSSSSSGGGGSSSSGRRIVSMFSFYTLPSSVLGHEVHTELRAAYMFYTVPGPTPLPQLMQDALITAAGKGYDVFNALDLLENPTFLKDLKFGIGDGALQYYLFNWRLANAPLAPSDVGLILL